MTTLDIFCHWVPPDYGAAALRAAGRPLRMLERALAMPAMTDLDARLRLMDRFPGYCQIPCLVSPPLEAIAGPEQAAILADPANYVWRAIDQPQAVHVEGDVVPAPGV